MQCPECGAVIPRPPAEFIARVKADPASLRLACSECGYVVTGVDAPCCPECGSARMVRFTGALPPRPRGRRIPIPIKVTTALGGLVAMTALSIGIVGIVAGGAAGSGGQAWRGLIVSLVPVGIGGAWMWQRRRLARLEPGERRALATVATVASTAALMVAVRILR